MTHSTGLRTDSPHVLQDIQDVVADVLGEFVQEPGHSVRSIAKDLAKEAVKGATIGAIQGVFEAIASLLRSGGVAVVDFVVRLLQRIQELLLQALEAMGQLVRRISGRSNDEAGPDELDEVEPDEFDEVETDEFYDDEDYDSDDARELAGRPRMGRA